MEATLKRGRDGRLRCALEDGRARRSSLRRATLLLLLLRCKVSCQRSLELIEIDFNVVAAALLPSMAVLRLVRRALLLLLLLLGLHGGLKEDWADGSDVGISGGPEAAARRTEDRRKEERRG